MPTIAGMRRRGYSPEALRAFAEMVGIAKANSVVDFGKLEFCLRDDLNHTAPRVLGVLHPIEVELTGWSGDGEAIDAPYFPPDVGKPGSRAVPLNGKIYIDRDDWRDDPPAGYHRLAPGRTVRMRYGYCITADEVVARDASGAATKLRATVHLDTRGGKNPADGRKVWGVIHWVDADTSIPAEVRLYDHLFTSPRPEEGGADFHDQLSKTSLEIVTTARLEASLAGAAKGSRWQLERIGYFVVDDDSKPGAIVLDRIVTLRSTQEAARPVVAAPADEPEHKINKKAATRPKSKSPAEYRAEARARDPELATAYASIAGVTNDEQADLLAADLATARLFLDTVAAGATAELVAKWIINELPRGLGARTLADAGLDAKRFGELLAAVVDGSLAANAAKTALGEMITTGKSLAELGPIQVVGGADLGAKIDAVIAANPDKAAQYKAGKIGLLGFFVGQVMKGTPNADAAAVNAAIRERLG
jgi:glutaminyl-tRNA synthetase